MSALLVFLGAGLGGVARYGISRLMATSSATFPWGTLLINVSGSLLITWFAATLQSRGLSQNWQLFLMVGVCGGYTTFSAFSAETLALIQSGNWPRALAYGALSFALCVGAAWIGVTLGAGSRSAERTAQSAVR